MGKKKKKKSPQVFFCREQQCPLLPLSPPDPTLCKFTLLQECYGEGFVETLSPAL